MTAVAPARCRWRRPVPSYRLASRLPLTLAALATALAVLALLPSLASAAGPALYCDGVLLDGGNTTVQRSTCVHSNSRSLTQVAGESRRADGTRGNAATCVGVNNGPYTTSTNVYNVCGGAGQEVRSGYLGFTGWPAIHNHSTFQSRFTGWFYYNP